jgi:hypothetical protein
MFPVDDANVFAAQWYKCYSNMRGLICKGDGATADMLIDTNTGAMVERDATATEWMAVTCDGAACEYYGKKCTEVMTLQFLLPDVDGLGVWQIDTGARNSIRNINSMVALIKSVAGHIAGIPLTLVLEPLEVTADGKKKTIYVLNIQTNLKLQNLVDVPRFKLAPSEPPDPSKFGHGVIVPLKEGETIPANGATVHVEPRAEYTAPPDPAWDAIKGGGKVEMPDPDKEVPEMIIPQNQEPKPATAARRATGDAPQFKTVGNLLTACHKDFKFMRAETLRAIGVEDTAQIADLNDAYAKVKAYYEANHGK